MGTSRRHDWRCSSLRPPWRCSLSPLNLLVLLAHPTPGSCCTEAMSATVTMGLFLGGFPLPLVAILAPLRTHPPPGVCRPPFCTGAILAPCQAVRISKAALTAPLVSPSLLVLQEHPAPRFSWTPVSLYLRDGPLPTKGGHFILMATCESPASQLPCALVHMFLSFNLGPLLSPAITGSCLAAWLSRDENSLGLVLLGS